MVMINDSHHAINKHNTDNFSLSLLERQNEAEQNTTIQFRFVWHWLRLFDYRHKHNGQCVCCFPIIFLFFFFLFHSLFLFISHFSRSSIIPFSRTKTVSIRTGSNWRAANIAWRRDKLLIIPGLLYTFFSEKLMFRFVYSHNKRTLKLMNNDYFIDCRLLHQWLRPDRWATIAVRFRWRRL